MDLEKFILAKEVYEELESSGFDAEKEKAYIKRVGSEWCAFGTTGREMGCYSDKQKAEERLAQIEVFKHTKAGTKLGNFICYCEEEGIYFFSDRRCEIQHCTPSGDNAIEVTWEF